MTVVANQTQKSLTREQKEAVGLLSIGTFLEYFDVMLYVHMAVLLNELFFPKTDPFIASLLMAFAFCSTYLLRPVGALVFGYIGDKIGRKHTIIITTFIMAFSCIVMANVPTYQEIGIAAAWIVTLCRMLQGMSAMGESTGAQIYLTEYTKRPIQFPAVASITVFAAAGTVVALAIAFFITSTGMNWRIVFWFGAAVAFIGTIARTKLREAPEFADAKKRVQRIVQDSNRDINILKSSTIWNEKVNKVTIIALFMIQCLWPASFYFGYMYCGDILKQSFGFSAAQVISQNFIVSLCQLCSFIVVTYLSYKIYPLFLSKVKLFLFGSFILICPYLLSNATSPIEIMLIQVITVSVAPSDFPAASIFYSSFPIFKRFTYGCLIYAISRAIMSVVISIGLVFLIHYYDSYGMLILILPIIIGYRFGLLHFESLEKAAGIYPSSETKSLIVYN